jgi:[glutamine synthetase] adenylyltransferase / [glutamine synthetase]-adenylyl-L-tyrosine phosphorylase
MAQDSALPSTAPCVARALRPVSATEPCSGDSRFVQRVRRRYAAEQHLLPAGEPTHASFEACKQALQAAGHSLGAALRIVRQLTLERLAVLDTDQQAPLEVITRSITALAEWALDTACEHAMVALDALHGAPLSAQGQRARLWVIGMGKLGARELNVSSDIDLIYVYDDDGLTAGLPDSGGRGRITHHEYFGKAVRHIYALVGDVTEHGFVFRVDLALRPNGNSGPPAVSLGALDDYFEVQGREWERFAWLKSRVVAPRSSVVSQGAQPLRSLVLPFVFRRYLDYNVFDALRTLHRQIREHAQKRSAGHPGRAHDVKLSPGGIREIEFTVQLLQVVRGGQFPELRTRPTLDALQRLAHAGLMPQVTADELAQAYRFLRQVEHRIQYLDDQQTHMLPTDGPDLDWIARSMAFTDTCAFLAQLDTHRERVAIEFDTLLGGTAPCKSCGKNGATPATSLTDLLAQLPPAVAERMAGWPNHPRVQALRDDSRRRLLRLMQRNAEWLRTDRVTELATVRMVDWLEPMLRRESYLALLIERPLVHERLLRLLGMARWPARYLQRHPGVIDELASSDMLSERFDAAGFEADLEERATSLRHTREDDDEALLNLLRRAHHAEVFRTLARDLEKTITTEQVADDLSALADAVLRITARWCWQRLKTRHRDEPAFAIIGYGKLGGKELGYGSDLDIVFVYDDDDERAAEIYAGFVRKMINWLSVKTGEGDLYEIDTALRPNGSSGLLVTQFTHYANYQMQRGSNAAWAWEHQAMTRARCVLGSGSDSNRWPQRFESVREAVITSDRDTRALRHEIALMRDRVGAAHPVREGRFDVKHSPGGMVDAEFAVQYLVLSHSAAHPALRDNVGNIALLARAETAGLLAPGTGVAAGNAYRELRRLQHQARLDEAPTQVVPASVAVYSAAIQAVWHQVLGPAGGSGPSRSHSTT